MSFIGPRPERPEFTAELEKRIPHYHMRHLVKPGLAGWAQINFPYGASVKDAFEKLQYDLYYIKHRSFIIDFGITLRTVAILLSSAGR
jgi:lipopolysaccharide/colanic/teichoic acid biosynthesis glycosyltransferase